MVRLPSRPRSLRLTRVLGLAVICAVAVAYVQPVRAYFDANDELDHQHAIRTALLHQQAALRERLDQAGTDDFVIREARRIGLVLPGEQLFIVKGVEKWRKAQVR